MAIVNNLWLRGTKKRLAGTVVYQSMGQTIQRELASQVTNPRTEAQMQQRVRWANIVALYRVLKPMMKYAFENKKRTQSDYNAFMSANISYSPIALTKQEAAAGACVVAPYTITRGTLPSVQIAEDTEGFVTNIFMPDGIDFDTASVKLFSEQVLAANPGLREGDQISFIRLTQSTNSVTGIPYVILRKYEVLLNTSNSELVSKYLPAELLDVKEAGNKVAISVLNNGGTGAFAIIVSRTVAGKTYVSTQELQPVNMAAMITAYSSEKQFAGAIASYGMTDDVFLSSDAAQPTEKSPVELTLMYLQSGNVSYFEGSQLPTYSQLEGTIISAQFNQAVVTADTEVELFVGSDGQAADNVSVAGDKVLFTIPEGLPFDAGDRFTMVRVIVDGVNHDIKTKQHYSPGLE